MTYVVVGAGEAGIHAALAMRSHGYQGELIVVGDEAHPPYTRPPLSKAVLTARTPSLPLIRDVSDLARQQIAMRLGTRVMSIDRERRRLQCADGTHLHYSKLVLATGCEPRRLEGVPTDSPRVLHLRTFEEALELRQRLEPGVRLVMIGGGYIGLEIAASARRMGCEVTVLESAPRIMARVVGPAVSAFLHALHESHGVRIITAEQICDVRDVGDGLEIRLRGDEVLRADFVVVGIGAQPRLELARSAGLSVGNGVVVDEFGRSSDAHIFACGDIAEHPNTFLGRRVRLESWQHAQRQAHVVGAAIAGANPKPYAVVPWFWTDQFDINVQMIGMPAGWTDEIVRGDPAGAFTVVYMDGSRVVGGAAVNQPREIAPIRAAIEKRLVCDVRAVRDCATGLASVFKAATRRFEDVS
jgi:3-phenylpropionate/trans-cinnamate dioxygenase ferredoxin reductase subunit